MNDRDLSMTNEELEDDDYKVDWFGGMALMTNEARLEQIREHVEKHSWTSTQDTRWLLKQLATEREETARRCAGIAETISMNNFEKWLEGVPGEFREAEISYHAAYIIRLYSTMRWAVSDRNFVASGYGSSLSAAMEDALREIRDSFEEAVV